MSSRGIPRLQSWEDVNEKEAKLFKTQLNTSIELPLKIVEIDLELDDFEPMNISELKELV